MRKIKDYIIKCIAQTFAALGLLVLLGGSGIFIFQIYSWLRYDNWTEYPIMIIEEYAKITWIEHPTSWYELHKIVVWILQGLPHSLVIIILGLLIFAFGLVTKDINDSKPGE